MKRLTRYLFFGSPSDWYLGGGVSGEAKAATVEWINDRIKLHIWLTSVATGTIVFFATLGPPTNTEALPGLVKVVGLGLMLASVLVNIVCVWSHSNWKLNVSRNTVTDGPRMRLDIEVTGWVAIACFFVGLVTAVIPVVV
jgi:hypothetical protein